MTLIASIVLLLSASLETSSDGLQQAVGQVQRETEGKILSARTVTVRGDQLYRIKVLTDDGRVQTRTIRPVARQTAPERKQGQDAKPKPPESSGKPETPEQSDSKE